MNYQKRFTYIHVETNSNDNVNLVVQQFGHSLGLFNQRDKESSCFRIFIALLKSAKANEKISSQELAYRTDLTRGTVVHHLNRLIEAGIVDVKQNRYFLRADNLKKLVSIVEKDTEDIIKDIKELAEKIDKELGI